MELLSTSNEICELLEGERIQEVVTLVSTKHHLGIRKLYFTFDDYSVLVEAQNNVLLVTKINKE